ncbi:MAG TPA: lysylphosphatidylglycerol synthase transmembrane domain-containing protein [bacterium]
MNKWWQSIIRITGFLLGIAAFVLAVYSIPLKEICSVVQAGFNRYLIFCVFLWMLSIVFQAWRWHVMLRWKKPVPFHDALKLFVLHRLANLLLPLRAGEGMRIFAARQQFNMNIPYLMATSINERILNLAFLVPLAFGLTFVIPDLEKYQAFLLICVFVFLTVITGIIWRHRSELSAPAVFESDRTADENRFVRFWRKFSQGLAILKSTPILLGVLLTSLGSWLVLWLGISALLQSLHTTSPSLGAWAVLLFTNIASLLPLTPSNIGPFQWGCILALSYFGVPQAEAVGFSLVLQAVRIVAAVLLGIYSYGLHFLFTKAHMARNQVAENSRKSP